MILISNWNFNCPQNANYLRAILPGLDALNAHDFSPFNVQEKASAAVKAVNEIPATCFLCFLGGYGRRARRNTPKEVLKQNRWKLFLGRLGIFRIGEWSNDLH